VNPKKINCGLIHDRHRVVDLSPSSQQISAAFAFDAQRQESIQECRNKFGKFGMNEDRISADRAAIEHRVAMFRETQAKFQRERDDYYDVTIERVRATDWNEFVSPRDFE
jgi:hypothetical protein